MLPWEQDIADCSAVAVDSQEAESQGDLGHQRTTTLDKQEDQQQRENSQQRKEHLVISTVERTHTHTGNTVNTTQYKKNSQNVSQPTLTTSLSSLR